MEQVFVNIKQVKIWRNDHTLTLGKKIPRWMKIDIKWILNFTKNSNRTFIGKEEIWHNSCIVISYYSTRTIQSFYLMN